MMELLLSVRFPDEAGVHGWVGMERAAGAVASNRCIEIQEDVTYVDIQKKEK
ncbi:MAG: hypothetical protein Q4D55_07995 [Eubacteriales bacterium]|nr:hypothetical protein [Eubacteriales bacterium]